MRRNHTIRRTAFFLSGEDLIRVLQDGLKQQVGDEILGQVVKVELHGDQDEFTLDVVFEREAD